MRELIACFRRDVLVASSYRMGLILSICSLLTVVIPLYFIARAIQPVIGPSISSEGGDYFTFVIAGLAAFQFVRAAITAIPAALSSGLRTGTFEALLATPSRLPWLLVGMLGYPFAWAVLRAVSLVLAGELLGAQFDLGRLLPAILLWACITIAYLPFGLLASALLLIFRTAGSLPSVVLGVSVLLGGVYYPTSVIPSWIARVSDLVPLTYGLRAMRRLLIEDASLGQMMGDLGALAALSIIMLGVSVTALQMAMRHARTTGTLAQY